MHLLNQKPNLATLKLKSGQSYTGVSFGADTSITGEAVFTTSLVGYPESMTDPSYTGQILVFTQPLIGNYGVPGPVKDKFGLYKYFESDKIQVSGIIVNDYAAQYSHWTAVESLGNWCKRYNIPAITGVDTRAIVQVLREQGSTLARLTVHSEEEQVNPKEHGFLYDPNADNLVARVSTPTPIHYNPDGDIKIAVVDCGVKQNIIRCLTKRGANVTVLPYDYNFNNDQDLYDGLFISNGPGNPETCGMTVVKHLQEAIQTFGKPIFGICMGNLLLGMAIGMKVYKLPFGNRGHNQPALHVQTGQCSITSQNHGYALDDKVMPTGWNKLFINANDGSNEGICHESLPIFSVQFHPEAKGGPQDTEYLFEEFITLVRAEKLKRMTEDEDIVA
ncbi:small subunit of carbamoyl-phosphate synthase [Phascolomyces articulosus]|uniref:Carbamoyl phosphate synthase arginine-specific small chain n=1 Tax=Phascolomyces articulosus TaxID=60185 RepID=A0AAD5JW03_9FUNG|nr:small subunit of carbamoyl-phosphate synthase [Phascolomyces articulosus]